LLKCDAVHISLHPDHPDASLGCVGSRLHQEDLAQVLSGDSITALRQRNGVPTMATGEVQDGAAWRQSQSLDDLICLLFRQLGDRCWSVDAQVVVIEEIEVPCPVDDRFLS
jgi:hypothetical protein